MLSGLATIRGITTAVLRDDFDGFGRRDWMSTVFGGNKSPFISIWLTNSWNTLFHTLLQTIIQLLLTMTPITMNTSTATTISRSNSMESISSAMFDFLEKENDTSSVVQVDVETSFETSFEASIDMTTRLHGSQRAPPMFGSPWLPHPRPRRLVLLFPHR